MNSGYIILSHTVVDRVVPDVVRLITSFIKTGKELRRAVNLSKQETKIYLEHPDFDVKGDEYTLTFSVYNHPVTHNREYYISALQRFSANGIVTVKQYPDPRTTSGITRTETGLYF